MQEEANRGAHYRSVCRTPPAGRAAAKTYGHCGSRSAAKDPARQRPYRRRSRESRIAATFAQTTTSKAPRPPRGSHTRSDGNREPVISTTYRQSDQRHRRLNRCSASNEWTVAKIGLRTPVEKQDHHAARHAGSFAIFENTDIFASYRSEA